MLIGVEFSILIGVGLSILMFVPRAARLKAAELTIGADRVIRDRQPDDPCCKRMVLLDLEGEFFFGAAPELDRYFDDLRERADVRIIVLRVKRTRNPDIVCMERLQHFIIEMQAKGVKVLLCGVRPDFAQAMQNLRFEDFLPAEHVFMEDPRGRLGDAGRRPPCLRTAGRGHLRPLSPPPAAGPGQRGVLLSDLIPRWG